MIKLFIYENFSAVNNCSDLAISLLLHTVLKCGTNISQEGSQIISVHKSVLYHPVKQVIKLVLEEESKQ